MSMLANKTMVKKDGDLTRTMSCRIKCFPPGRSPRNHLTNPARDREDKTAKEGNCTLMDGVIHRLRLTLLQTGSHEVMPFWFGQISVSHGSAVRGMSTPAKMRKQVTNQWQSSYDNSVLHRDRCRRTLKGMRANRNL